MTITVFNDKSTAHKTGTYPLFGGQEPALYDSVNQPYPKFFNLMEQLKQIDWSQDDVDLTETRMDLLRMPKELRELMLFNLAYQWSLDSIATAIPTLLAPFVTNSEYGHVLAKIGENENLHSVTYSNIVRQCVPDPQEVFDMVFKHEEVLQRSSVVGKVLSDLKRVGAEYTLGMKTFEQCMPYVLEGVIAIYALERISFMSSFACTFALAEQEYCVGAARLVQKILQDEMIHFETQRYAIEILKQDEKFAPLFEKDKEKHKDIINGVVFQETEWNHYLFQGSRSIVGLNEGILNDWTRYNAQEVCDEVGVKPSFRITKTCPLPWFEQDWMDLNAQQNANMEADPTNYQVNTISRDIGEISFAELGFDDLEEKQDTSFTGNFIVYSKPECPFCVKIKCFMEENGLPYTEVDVSEDEYLLEEFKQKMGHKTVPQVYDENMKYHGDCTAFIKKFS
ncbi:putative ribonucleoside diphosphate reductase, betachain [Vibrio phage 501E54-1]|nr:putative ribonucleoside diphosphate reductase, betachain [Vibrio phage 501E54-1]